MWPAVTLGALLANSWTGVPFIAVAGITLGNTLEAVAGAYLLRRAQFRPSLDRLRDVAVLFGLAGLLSTTAAATIGVASLWIAGTLSAPDLASAWRVWWLGDMGGVLLVTPLIFVFAAGIGFSRRPARVAEAAALLAAALAVALVWISIDQPPAYLAFPLIIWAALRFSHAGAVLASFGLAGIGVVYTSQHLGPFARGSADGSLLLSQCFMGVAAATALTLAAVTAERRRAERALRAARDELEVEVRERTADLVRSNTELEQFAHVVSHDLSEPLRGIAGFAELLADRYQGRLDPRADGYIHHIVDGATRMKTLIDALLAYSEAGAQGVHAADVSCETLLREAKVALATTIDESDAVVTADPLPTVHGDPVLLGDVFQNLLSNALKFSNGDGCRVHVSAEREDEHWRLSFRDHGVGIEPKYSDQVFGVFKRLYRRDEYPGAGVGLAIAKKIVESHGGDIWVECAQDSGSVFSFTLPDTSKAAC